MEKNQAPIAKAAALPENWRKFAERLPTDQYDNWPSGVYDFSCPENDADITLLIVHNKKSYKLSDREIIRKISIPAHA